ncbi:DCC1-like thiol-disulfide oxidoreductase family protein [uncultured Croceitalea sp.]|uniref:DCC1-like thiol-disulfide oxidoreductase family protein n=1 Tax=uncultured Croceitalea sp. TaxID=1798908 RepID=UPI0033056AEB
MKTIVKTLKERWFEAISPQRLALLRIATGCFSLWYLISRFEMLQNMIKNTSAFDPIGVLFWMEEPLSATTFWWVSIALITLNVLYVLGWKFRYTGPVFALLTLLFFTYRNSWSMIYHNRNALVLHIVILGLVASADAWSIDAWRRRLNDKKVKKAHYNYGWPVMLICAVTLGSYFLSGVAKIAGDLAFEWANGSAMRSQVAVDAIRKSVLVAETAPFFKVIYQHTWLFLGMGILTLILEIGAPIALVKKRWGMVWAVLTWSMHWGIFLIMGIRFRYQMTGLLFLSFFEPEKWIASLNKKVKGKQSIARDTTAVVFFDGVCSLCNAWIRFVIRWDKHNRFRFAPLQSATAQKILGPDFSAEKMDSIVLVDGTQKYIKSDAILKITKELGLPFKVIYVLRWLPLQLRNRIYDVVARSRYSWFGKQANCRIPTAQERWRFLES